MKKEITMDDIMCKVIDFKIENCTQDELKELIESFSEQQYNKGREDEIDSNSSWDDASY